jgi:hypothetical protein
MPVLWPRYRDEAGSTDCQPHSRSALGYPRASAFGRGASFPGNSPCAERRSAAELFMTPRSKKLLALVTKEYFN